MRTLHGTASLHMHPRTTTSVLPCAQPTWPVRAAPGAPCTNPSPALLSTFTLDPTYFPEELHTTQEKRCGPRRLTCA